MKRGHSVYRWITALLLLLTSLSMTGLPLRAHAQGGEIRLLGPVTGRLDAATPEATFAFAMNANLAFSLAAEIQSGDLALDMTVLDASGSVLAQGTPRKSDPPQVVVEAVAPPADGTYSVTLRRSGDTSGDYQLTLLPGYGTWSINDTFDESGDPMAFTWTPDSSDTVSKGVVNGELMLSVKTEGSVGYTRPDETVNWSDFYAEAEVRVEGQPSYYEYGFVFRYTPVGDSGRQYYLLSFSNAGDWSAFLFDQGTWTELVPWTKSPVIDLTDPQPRIALLVQGSIFKLYFNDRLVGEASDPTNLLPSGEIALEAATQTGQTDMPVTVYFDNLAITSPAADVGSTGLGGLFGGKVTPTTPAISGLRASPTPASGLPFGGAATKTPLPAATPTKLPLPAATPTKPPIAFPPTATPTASTSVSLVNWASSQPSNIVSELRQLELVPSDGGIALSIPTSFGDTSAEGFSFYSLGQGRSFGNFVLGFDAHLDISGPASGCGMHFRETGTSRDVAMVMANGMAYLGQFDNGEEHPSSAFDTFAAIQPGQGTVNRVLIIAMEDQVTMFVNGELFNVSGFTIQSGTLALEVYVMADDAGNTQRTYCQLDNIWLWQF